LKIAHGDPLIVMPDPYTPPSGAPGFISSNTGINPQSLQASYLGSQNLGQNGQAAMAAAYNASGIAGLPTDSVQYQNVAAELMGQNASTAYNQAMFPGMTILIHLPFLFNVSNGSYPHS
jgi:hypothetical protein